MLHAAILDFELVVRQIEPKSETAYDIPFTVQTIRANILSLKQHVNLKVKVLVNSEKVFSNVKGGYDFGCVACVLIEKRNAEIY